MIHNDVLNQLQFLIKTSVPPLVEVSQTPLAEPQWVPGQRLTAVVLANLPNGRFQVQIGEQVLDMNLPRNTQPGEQVELTFVSSQPRLTFVLTRDLAAAAAANVAEAKPQVALSDTARFLGGLLQKISTPEDGLPTPLARSSPLLAGAPADIKEFSGILRNALSQSGLFYESHQAQWVAGERKLADLQQEPQARLPVMNPAPGAPAEMVQKNTPVAMTPDAALAQGASKLPIHADAVPLVQQQLQTLDTHQMVWQGQVWPGQTMEWRVEERNARGGGGEDTPHWQTSLRLQLPRMGDVQAALAITPQGLRINLKADDGAAELMKGAQDSLRRAMETSGLHLLGISVESHEKA
ncbi:MAG: flagellar hook-length control protein FliK [Sulfuricella sp.]|nr:flagellar hook-length control protein FliK [Sulfuricella sp.]